VTDLKVKPTLARALALSHELLAAAEAADLQGLASLDAQRLELLKSFRLDARHIDAGDRVLLQQISQLNEQAIGLLHHHQRSKGRDMDMAAVGRRAVVAYSNIRLQR
jgi:hypothetical protein